VVRKLIETVAGKLPQNYKPSQRGKTPEGMTEALRRYFDGKDYSTGKND
jgi:hypothetical protein